MSGFETMKSSCNNFLHPTVDSSDKYDPTFLGVTRRAKLTPNYTPQQEEKGKRIRVDMKQHDPSVLLQLPQQFVEPKFSNNVEGNRFGPGFHRRSEKDICQDRLRVIQDEDAKGKREQQANALRERGAARNFSQFDTITGQPTFITKYYPTVKPASSDRPELLHKAMRWPERVVSTVLPNSVMEAAMGGSANSNSSTSGRHLTVRQQRLLNEGLTTTKKDWSVGKQLQCQDGYVLPKL